MTSIIMPMASVMAGPFTNAGTTLVKAGGTGGAELGAPGDLTLIVGRIISVVLSFSGIILLCYFIYAGFLWMTASGDSKKVDKAKDILKNAIIGGLVLATAYALSAFVIDALTQVTDPGTQAGSSAGSKSPGK